jgi:hypothetical protein
VRPGESLKSVNTARGIFMATILEKFKTPENL